MPLRTNRIWFGATRTAVLALLFLGMTAGTASSHGYMPPPIQQPVIVPDELPGEGQQQIAGAVPDRSQVGERGGPIAQEEVRRDPLARFIDRILEIFGRYLGAR